VADMSAPYRPPSIDLDPSDPRSASPIAYGSVRKLLLFATDSMMVWT
jgi:hypothetical protein